MVLLRSRVGYLMAIVGVIAINLAAARAYISGSEHFGWDLYSLLEVVPIGVGLQVAILQLIRSPGRGRLFWAAFVACGIVSMATLIWARFDPPYETTTFSTAGPVASTSYPGCLGARLWEAYMDLAYKGLERIEYPYGGGTVEFGDCVTTVVLVLSPQLFLAWATGGLAL